MNSLEDALKQFMEANAIELPEGNDTTDTDAEEKPAMAKQQGKLQVVVEKKGRGGKTATIITGFTIDDAQIASLATHLKSKLGTGGSARGGEILIQGDRRPQVIELLRAKGFKA